jgi:hypothetical protein
VRLFVLLAGALFAGAAGCICLGQSTVTTYTPDLANGGYAVSSASTSSDHTQTQITQSLNGGQVPLEQHEERVIRKDSTGSVTETIIRRYTPDGQFASTERTITESHTHPDGSSTVQSTTYRADVNGTEAPAERRTIDTQVAGKTTTTNTVIEQPGQSGSFETVEKQAEVTEDLSQGTQKKSSTTESIYRGIPGEGFREAVRKVITETQSDDQTVKDVTDYEPGSNAGSLQFQERRVSTTSTTPGGSQSTIVNVYAPSVDGVSPSSGDPPQLKQQQIITRIKNPDGSVVDTFSVREPNVSEPTELGDVRQITQTVCTGNCAGAPTAPPAAPPNDPAAKP